MPRIKIKGKNLAKSEFGGECPEGYKKNEFNICIPDFESQYQEPVTEPNAAVDFAETMKSPSVAEFHKQPFQQKEDVPKQQNTFWGDTKGQRRFNKTMTGFAIGSLALNKYDQYKKQQDYDQWSRSSNLPDNFYAANTSQDRGDYDINNGTFRPKDMGYKSKGTQANAYYGSQNFAKFGGLLKAQNGMAIKGDTFVQSSFIPDAPLYIPPRNTSKITITGTPTTTSSSEKVVLSNDFNNYAEKAQKYISKVNPNTDITGSMLANGAQKAFESTGKIVPVELALAQLQQEGYLAKGKTNKPQRTKNPFNVGNTDSGDVVKYNNLQPAVDNYFNLLAKHYLKNNTADQLLNNFVNSSGNRYAKDENYENALKNNIKNINNYINNTKVSSSNLIDFANTAGFDITSTTGGEHNKGSKHYQGKAIDIRTRNKSPEEIASFMSKAQEQGFRVLDEREKPAGQAVWNGPHLHLEKAQYGGLNNNSMKIKITESPDENQEMAHGGQPKYAGQSNYGLYIGQRDLYKSMAKHPHDDPQHTVTEKKETPEDPYVLEAEGGETILRPDGTHMTITGKRHTEGGEKLTKDQAPEGSFIYSDTKKLKIKKPEVLKHFGKGGNVKGGVTPADIAKQYDVNKYRAILQDNTKDKLAKDTARLMIGNYEKKLAELALVQESMKGFPQGVPDIAKGLVAQQGPQQTQAAFGGYFADGGMPYYQMAGQKGNTDQYMWGNPSITGAASNQQAAPPVNPNAVQLGTYVDPAPELPQWFNYWTKSNTPKGSKSPKGPQSTYDPKVGNHIYDDYKYWRQQHGKDFTGPADYQKYVFSEIQNANPDAYKYIENTWGPTAAGRWDDSVFGARTAYASSQRKPVPKIPEKTITITPPPIVDVPVITPPVINPPSETPPNIPPPRAGWTSQNRRDLANAGLDYLSLKKYHPHTTNIQPVLPEFIPQDWRGYAAAMQSQQNAAANQMGTYQPGQSMASNLSFLQGQGAGELGKYISGVDQYNATGATNMDLQRANILNQYTQANAANRDKDLMDENTLDSKYREAERLARKGVVKAADVGEDAASKIYNTNLTEKYFKIDPRTQRMVFHSDNAKAAWEAATKGGGADLSSADLAAFNEIYNGLSYLKGEERSRTALNILNKNKSGSTTTRTYPGDSKKNNTTETEPITKEKFGGSIGTQYVKTISNLYNQLSYIADPEERQRAAEAYAKQMHFNKRK
jgi:hypothetical protein